MPRAYSQRYSHSALWRFPRPAAAAARRRERFHLEFPRHNFDRRNPFDIVANRVRDPLQMRDATREDDPVHAAANRYGKLADVLGDVVGKRLQRQLRLAVTGQNSLFDLLRVAGSLKLLSNRRCPAAAGRRPNNQPDDRSNTYQVERGNHAGAFRAKRSLVVPYGIDVAAVVQ